MSPEFTLPLEKDNSLLSKETMNRKVIHILLVEDSETHVAIISETLESLSSRVKLTVAQSLADAHAYLAESIPDLAIIDLLLPDGRGTELLPTTKEEAAFPIIIMTSDGDEEAAVEAMKGGALDYLVKSAATLTDMPRIVERTLREWEHIEKRKRAEQTLVAANEQLRAEIANRQKAEQERDRLFERSIDMFAVGEINGFFKQINPAWTKALGWTEQELLGRPYIEFVHPDDHDATLDAAEQLLATRKMHGFENRYRCKDGTYRWISWNSFSLPEEGLTFAVARDITERKRAEEELREREQQYHAFFENNHAVMLLIDPVNAAIVDANPAACSFYGHAKEELTKKKIFDINTLPRDQVFQEMERAKKEQRRYFHFKHRLEGGAIRDVEVFSGPVTVRGKDLLYSIVHDISERKKAEKSLRESEQRLEKLLDNLPGVGIVGRDEKGDIIWVNQEMKKLTGYDQELLGDFRQVLKVLNPDRAYRDWVEKEFQKAGDDYRNLEVEIDRRDGGRRTFSYSNISENVSIPGFARWAIGIDITERKQAEKALRKSEARLKATHNNVAAGIAVLDAHGRYVEINERYEVMLGYSKDEIFGRAPAEITFQEDKEESKVQLEKLLSGEAESYRREKRYVRKDGSIFWVDYSATRILDENGELEAIVGIFIDVTDRKITEEKLREANRKLDAFVYTVSHDLRSPLTPIIGYADFMRVQYREQLDADALGFLDKIKEQGNRMMALMEDLLTLATVGHLEKPTQPVDVKGVIQTVLEERKSQIADAKVNVEIGELSSVYVPKSLLNQVFDNLIGNAIRYAGREEYPIVVGEDLSEDRVRFYVRDHGPGIHPEERNRIFEVFYRGSTGKKVHGTGVGLAAVRKIAQLFGGRAWVEETPGGGSTFWVEMEGVKSSV